LINDIEVAVFGKRCGFKVRIRRRTAERYGIGELEVFGVGLVDSVQRRVTLRVVGPVIHQPVLWFLVGIYEPIRGHFGRRDRTDHAQNSARQETGSESGPLEHDVSPMLF
jgi:hypothetical protein